MIFFVTIINAYFIDRNKIKNIATLTFGIIILTKKQFIEQ